jgi:hypothetical protein
MIEVKIEAEDKSHIYSFPENWNEVTVKQFVRLYQSNNPNNNELMGAVTLISAISNIPEGLLMQMDINDFKNLSTKANFIAQEVEKTDVDYIELEGDRYYLYTEFNKLTTGEVITIETILEGSQYDIYKVMGDLLCLFLRKKDEQGKFEKFSTDMFKRKEMFMDVPISNIYHVFGFFLDGRNSSQSNMKDYTKNNNQSTTPKEDLPKN